MGVWTHSGGLLSNCLGKHLPALHFQPLVQTFWLPWSINWVWVKAPQMIWVLQSVNNGILVYEMLNLKYIFEVDRCSPEPFTLGPLTGGRMGTLGVGTANPWKLSKLEDCEWKKTKNKQTLSDCLFQHLRHKKQNMVQEHQ